jgi:hypothetical protein
MSVNFRYPNITGVSDREQLAQIKSYLHQLVEQLNYAFSTIGSWEDSAVTNTGQSYDELKNLVMTEIQRINTRIAQMGFTEEDKAQIVEEVLAALESTQ